ncbi:hypothetical protein LIER_34455 [Lithospermum erythrorhizon]|uniref:Reverse transcriptase domain-containing protein n=1 Tax=Lithospermum erythrorhizon TaxID=34254 RepID=A0AAV3S377_LITER
MGDFNDLLSSEEKLGGIERTESSMQVFREFVKHCQLLDIGYVGHPYTWAVTNKEVKREIFDMPADKSPGPDVSYSFMINGAPRGFIRLTRGIRQGDPLSSYLCLLCAEGLTCMIREAESRRSFSGIKISRYSPSISHILFGDDTIIFCKATSSEWAKIMRILQEYEEASGQKVGRTKKELFRYIQAKVETHVRGWKGQWRSLFGQTAKGIEEFIGRRRINWMKIKLMEVLASRIWSASTIGKTRMALWFATPLNICTTGGPWTNFREWWVYMMTQFKSMECPENFDLLAWILWFIWKFRNGLVFGEANLCEEAIWQEGYNLYENYKNVYARSPQLLAPSVVIDDMECWQRPSRGWLKINTDACWLHLT